ncbi:hypothetical protein GCM10010345_86050 [Streptomyces canarius]|uniref:Uncharacterized protein n=1 Tax=Streptomyces canarius TaxID=285453 RepID=A0ABQ3DA96_9ACTN|nr:hypothetical protein GCM10010345_86050 [Streptomyces canarius]
MVAAAHEGRVVPLALRLRAQAGGAADEDVVAAGHLVHEHRAALKSLEEEPVDGLKVVGCGRGMDEAGADADGAQHAAAAQQGVPVTLPQAAGL